MPLPKPIIFLLAILGGVVVPLALFVLIRLAVDKVFGYLEAWGLWVPPTNPAAVEHPDGEGGRRGTPKCTANVLVEGVVVADTAGVAALGVAVPEPPPVKRQESARRMCWIHCQPPATRTSWTCDGLPGNSRAACRRRQTDGINTATEGAASADNTRPANHKVAELQDAPILRGQDSPQAKTARTCARCNAIEACH